MRLFLLTMIQDRTRELLKKNDNYQGIFNTEFQLKFNSHTTGTVPGAAIFDGCPVSDREYF